MKQLSAFTALLIIFLATASVSAQSQDPPDESELALRIVERTIDDISDADGWEIKVKYPEVRLEGDKPSPAFNKESKALALKEVERFKKDAGEFKKDASAEERANYFLLIEYSTEYFDESMISVKFSQSEYLGGAHPNHWTYVLNFDLTDDKKIELQDLFIDGSGYLDVISKKSIRDISTRLGTDADDDWIKTGAGSEIKNFSSWNITKNGLLFTFDPYKVGPYVVGSSESVVPFGLFSERMQGKGFYLAQTAAYIDGSPANWCRGGRWTMQEGPFKLARVIGKKNTRAYFYDDAKDCPDGENCREKSYLIAGDEIVVNREFGDYSCAWYQTATGYGTVGWIKTDMIATRAEASKPPRGWIGNWVYGEGDIEIKESSDGKLKVTGNAFWRGMGDNIHIGELDYTGVPVQNTLKVGDGKHKYDCNVTLRLLGKYLIVSDNLHCGGANVSFNGIYLRSK